jgi:hypothetical protein
MAATVVSKIYLFFRELTYEYNPATDQYTRKSDSPIARTWATCAVVTIGSKDRIYIIGGSDSKAIATDANYYFVPSTNTWSLPQPSAPYRAYGVTRDNPVRMNMIYYGFGHDGSDRFFKEMYLYEPASTRWSKLPSASCERDGVACAVIDSELYVVGGRNQAPDKTACGLTECEALTLRP